jgi:hypothetical protein
MRTAFLGVAALAAAYGFLANPTPAQAYPIYPWCADLGGGRGGGATNCYFRTWDQCRLAASGNGGICYRNPFYGYGSYGGGVDVDAPRRKGWGY